MSRTQPLRTGRDVRLSCRGGEITGQTSGLADGFAQANLVILPRSDAADFLLFCQRNPKPCPLLEVTDVGSPIPRRFAPDGDLRTDLPRYRVWRSGKLTDEPTDIAALWRDDFVSFLIGCSFTFETPLRAAGIPVRHIDEGRNVPMYRTNIPCESAGPFAGELVVSMRPLKPADAIKAIQFTSRFPGVHGAPVHFGDPEAIGIGDLSRPDFGDSVTIHANEVPVFWACGVTPQVALMNAAPQIAITHSPGCMFVTDIRDDELAV
jgi:uncharacterized protein YcsI (UPF0317 family)